MESSRESVTEAVIEAVADYADVEKTELQEPLYDAIEPDALDRLFYNGQGKITFEYLEFIVAVDDEYKVEIASVNDD